MMSNLLCAIAAFSWVIDTSMVSIFLFGEYPYPEKDQNS